MWQMQGDGRVQTCDGLTRRDFMQVGTLGATGLTLAEWNRLEARGAVDPSADVNGIMIFNLGARANWTPGT